MKTVLQVALDFTDTEKAIEVGKKAVEGGAEWVEAGTPLIKSEGLSSVEKLDQSFPDKTIVADMKTMDTGKLEFGLAGKAGAEVVTVLGACPDETIEGAVDAAEDGGLVVVADLIGVEDVSKRASELEDLGVDYVIAHTGIDQQSGGKDPLEDVRSIVDATSIPVAAAGGLDEKTAPQAVEAGASIVIVGGAITSASDPCAAARNIFETMEEKA